MKTKNTNNKKKKNSLYVTVAKLHVEQVQQQQLQQHLQPRTTTFKHLHFSSCLSIPVIFVAITNKNFFLIFFYLYTNIRSYSKISLSVFVFP